jgi:hypothetical protein
LRASFFFYRHQLKPQSLPNVNPFHSGGHRMIVPLTRRRLLSAHNIHKIDLLTLTRALESTGARMLCTSNRRTRRDPESIGTKPTCMSMLIESTGIVGCCCESPRCCNMRCTSPRTRNGHGPSLRNYLLTTWSPNAVSITWSEHLHDTADAVWSRCFASRAVLAQAY